SGVRSLLLDSVYKSAYKTALHYRPDLLSPQKKLQHAYDIQSNKDFQNIFDTATAYKTRKEKIQLIISAHLSSRTLVHLKQLDNYNAVILATNIAYNRNNLLPVTSFNTASLKGLFALKLFGVFLMIAINFNTTSDYHWDEHDAANSLCILVVLGDYKGGELCFSQLQIVVHLWPEQIINFTKVYKEARIEKAANKPEQDLNNAQ
ncbi:18211_t:CDS:2, partial [Racocetra persica]